MSDKHTQAPDLISTTSYNKKANLTKLNGKEQVTGLLAAQVPFSRPHLVSAMPGVYLRQHRKGDFVAAQPKYGVHPAGRIVSPSNKAALQLSALYLSAVGEAWTSAVREAVDHILLVIENNQDKDLAQILFRPDVQDALESAGEGGAKVVIREVERIWKESGAPDNSPYLSSVVGDAQRNGNTFADRMTTAMLQADKSKIENVLLRDRLRAASAQAVIETRSDNERRLHSMRLAGVSHIEWQARRIPGTNEFEPDVCTTCRELDGQVVALGHAFDVGALIRNKLKLYGDLIVPPAHPNCKCKIVPSEKG